MAAAAYVMRAGTYDFRPRAHSEKPADIAGGPFVFNASRDQHFVWPDVPEFEAGLPAEPCWVAGFGAQFVLPPVPPLVAPAPTLPEGAVVLEPEPVPEPPPEPLVLPVVPAPEPVPAPVVPPPLVCAIAAVASPRDRAPTVRSFTNIRFPLVDPTFAKPTERQKSSL